MAANVNGTDHAALFQRILEYGETAVLHRLRQVYNGQVKAQVGLIGAVLVHALGPGVPGERAGEFYTHELLEHIFEHALQVLEHILLLHKAHFHIHLGELRLTVRPQVLVSETPGHLIIPVNTAHHQKLLENLRGLGQGIELAVVYPGGHQIVSCALGGRFRQHGGFHRQEAVGVQIVLCALLHPMAEFQPPNHLRTAQIQIAILEPQGLVAGAVLHREGQRVRLGDHLQPLGPKLYGAGFQLGVDRLRVALPDIAMDCNDRLIFQPVCRGKFLRRQLPGIEYHLQNAFPISQVNEYNAAHVALGLHPAADGFFLSNCRFSQCAAVNGALEHENHPFQHKQKCPPSRLQKETWDERHNNTSVVPPI